eukprot:jgi/Picsp_1/4612/NSC_01982-R1_protein
MQNLRDALFTLHSGDGSLQKQSNSWLTEFVKSQDAWPACLDLYNQMDGNYMIQFSCLSMLLRKVRSEWPSLEEGVRVDLRKQFRAMLEKQLCHSPSGGNSRLLSKQLVLLCVVCIDNEHDMDSLIHDGLSLMPRNPEMGLEMLDVLPQELRESSRRSHNKLLEPLISKRDFLLDKLDGYMVYFIHSENPQETFLASKACSVLHSWVDLPSIPGGMPQYPLEQFFARHNTTFQILLQICTIDNEELMRLIESATDTILSLLKASYPEEEGRQGPFDALVQGMVQGLAHGTIDEERARCLARLGSGLAECWPEGAAARLSEAESLCDLMIMLVQHSEPVVIECSIDYFLAINLVEMRERRPALGRLLHARLLEALHSRLRYPSAECDISHCLEDETYCRLRKEIVPEVLQECYTSLRNWYAESICSALEMANTWQESEICMYVIRSASLQIRTYALRHHSENSLDMEAQKTNQILCNFFRLACAKFQTSSVVSSAHSWIMADIFCSVSESFAVWFAKEENAPVKEVFETALLLLASFPGPVALRACGTINSICLRCSNRFKQQQDLVLAFLNSIHGYISQNPWREGNGELVESLCHLACTLPKELSREYLLRSVLPYVQALNRISIAQQNNASNSETEKEIVDSLLSFSRSFKALLPSALAAGDDGGWAAVYVFQSIEQILLTLCTSPTWRNQNGVLEAIIDVCKQAVCSARNKSSEILPLVLPLVTNIFHSSMVASALGVLSEIIEMNFQDTVQMNDIVRLSCTAFRGAFDILQQEGLLCRPLLVSSLLEVGYSFLVYSPSELIKMGSTGSFIDLAVAALSCREPEIVVGALQLLQYVPTAATSDDLLDPSLAGVLLTNFSERGNSIVEGLLFTLFDTCPRQKMRSVANFLRTILISSHFVTSSQHWLSLSLQSDRLLEVAGSEIANASIPKFHEIVLSKSLRPQRLACLILDLGLIVRREEQPDALLSYEL